MGITYKTNQDITPEQFIELIEKTSLGPRRPTDNLTAIKGMLDNANLIITAWDKTALVGIARSVTDFHFCCYLSDLAVDENIQSAGIGKQLIFHTKQALSPECKLILIAAPLAEEYYPKIGFDKHPSAWVLSDVSQLKI